MPHDLTDRPSGTGATGRADGRDGISAGMPSRRLLLVTAGWWGAALSAGVTLSACGLRLEDDLTLLPPALRRAMPDEDLLVAARTRAAALAVLARSALDGALLAGRHERQRDLLDALLDAGGVPADARGPSSTAALSPSSAPTGALPSGSVPPSPTVGTIDLAAAHGAATIDALPGLGQAGVY
ncbi:MAG: hypothetical protein WAR57_06820, partial [Candidatus Phosphoribacter sp.]